MSSPAESIVQSDPFRQVLRRYIAEAPSGFVALGAQQDGAWTPTVGFPGAISCRGGGPNDGPFIECVLYSSQQRPATEAEFAVIAEKVEAMVPGWKKSDITATDMPRVFFSNGPTLKEATTSVDVAIVQLGDNYNVNLVVQTWNLAR